MLLAWATIELVNKRTVPVLAQCRPVSFVDRGERVMPKNRLKASLREGKAVSGPIMEEARTVGPVKMLALSGHDFLWFDTEHSMLEWDTLLTLVQYSLAVGITPLVRVTDLQYPLVARALDLGAQGVIIPRVETREEVERAVSYAKYLPLGRRGAGGRARYAYEARGVGEAVEEANAETMVIVQVESREAVANLNGIASVPGLDVVCIGPQDLSIDLGVHGQFDHPTFIDTVKEIVAACSKHNIPVGMVSREAASFRQWYDLGIRFLVCNSDGNYIVQGATRDVQTLREITSGVTQAGD
jgi:2-dehydro-3-deoxyglucarate aldolase/4-hydroxy-2-oxoheptanedioate aldolase